MKEKIIALFVIALVGVLGFVWFSPSGLKPAPEVAFNFVDGRKLTMQELKGRPVLVTFWATSCSGCVKEIPHLAELYQEMAPRGLEIIGVAMAYDPPNHVMTMRKEKAIPYPIALDIDSKIALAFGDIKLTPTSFLIDPNGQIVKQKIGEMDMTLVKQRILGMLNAKG